MNYFLDTSAIIKIYHGEGGTVFMRGLYRDSHAFTISELASLEFTSVMYRRCRAGDFGGTFRGELISRCKGDQKTRYQVVGVNSDIIEEAARIVELVGSEVSMRSLDAIQVACFVTYCDEKTVFLSSDKKLNAVVQAIGRSVVDPVSQ